jgi:hypothetical protein
VPLLPPPPPSLSLLLLLLLLPPSLLLLLLLPPPPLDPPFARGVSHARVPSVFCAPFVTAHRRALHVLHWHTSAHMNNVTVHQRSLHMLHTSAAASLPSWTQTRKQTRK